MSSVSNLVGKRFGFLTVVKRAADITINGRKLVSWACVCSCGKPGCPGELNVPKYSLTRIKHPKIDCGCSPKLRDGTCGDCDKPFSSTRLRPCRDGVLRCKKCTNRHTPMQRDYGLSLTEYNGLLERQGGVCAVCKEPPPKGRQLCVDHDHATGFVRGILCNKCNLALGYTNDNLTTIRRLLNYLLRHGADRGWDHYFLDLAELASSRSKDPSTQCGAVIVKDRNLLSTGYNGFPRGWDDSLPENYDRPFKYAITIHAEVNGILNASRGGGNLQGSTLYTTPIPPCGDCAKAIVQAGIKRVVTRVYGGNERWADSNALARRVFQDCGVEYVEADAKA